MSAWLKAFQTLADKTQTAPSPSELLCLLVKLPTKGRGHMQDTAVGGHQFPGKTTGSHRVPSNSHRRRGEKGRKRLIGFAPQVMHTLLLLLGPYHFCPLLSPSLHEIFPWYPLIFLKRSLVFPILLFSSISLHWLLRTAFLSLLAILWKSEFKWVYLSFSPLPFTSLLLSAICKAF